MLFVSLVILLMLLLFAIAAANTAISERRMADDARNRQLARLAADSALSEAKTRIATAAVTYGGAGVCAHLRCFIRRPGSPQSASDLMRAPEAQAAMNSFRLDPGQPEGTEGSARIASSTYLIEDLGMPAAAAGEPSPAGSETDRVFRIIARGTAEQGDYVQVVEATFSVTR